MAFEKSLMQFFWISALNKFFTLYFGYFGKIKEKKIILFAKSKTLLSYKNISLLLTLICFLKKMKQDFFALYCLDVRYCRKRKIFFYYYYEVLF